MYRYFFLNRFKKSGEDGRDDLQPSRSASAAATSNCDNETAYSSIVPQTSVFTLGFAPPPAAGGTTAGVGRGEGVISSPPHFHHTHHNTSFSPGKLFMPAGKEVMKKAPLVILKTKRLLRQEMREYSFGLEVPT